MSDELSKCLKDKHAHRGPALLRKNGKIKKR